MKQKQAADLERRDRRLAEAAGDRVFQKVRRQAADLERRVTNFAGFSYSDEEADLVAIKNAVDETIQDHNQAIIARWRGKMQEDGACTQ